MGGATGAAAARTRRRRRRRRSWASATISRASSRGKATTATRTTRLSRKRTGRREGRDPKRGRRWSLHRTSEAAKPLGVLAAGAREHRDAPGAFEAFRRESLSTPFVFIRLLRNVDKRTRKPDRFSLPLATGDPARVRPSPFAPFLSSYVVPTIVCSPSKPPFVSFASILTRARPIRLRIRHCPAFHCWFGSWACPPGICGAGHCPGGICCPGCM